MLQLPPLPRWINANTETTSNLASFYEALSYSPGLSFRRQVKDLNDLNLFNSIHQPTYFLVGGSLKVYNPDKLSKVEVTCTDPYVYSTTVDSVNFLDNLYFTRQPSYFHTISNPLLFNNINLVTDSITVSGGSYDLTTIFGIHVPETENYIEVKGEEFKDWGIVAYNNVNKIALPDGDYDIRYRSITLLDAFIAGTYTIRFNGEILVLKKKLITNYWDDLGSIMGLTRLKDEFNYSYRLRLQQYALAKSVPVRIAIGLNTTKLLFWNTVVDRTFDLEDKTYHVDFYERDLSSANEITLYKVENEYKPTILTDSLFSRQVAGEYSTNGIIPLYSNLQSITASYFKKDYYLNINPSTKEIANVNCEHLYDSVMVVTSTKIKVSTVENTPTTNTWGKESSENYITIS